MPLRLKRDIVPIEEWLSSPYYLGPEAGALYPFWREHVANFFNRNDITFILHGSYSLGKTYVALIMLLRQLYEMSCFEGFPSIFGLSPSSKVTIAFVSTSATKAKTVGIAKLIRMFDEIPYFKEHCPRNEETDTHLDLGFVDVFHASNVGHLISEDLFGVIFDEANFVKAAAGEEYDKAKVMFLEARLRGATRFSVNGTQLGFFGLLSSANEETSFTEQEIKRAREAKDTYIVEAATYDVKPQAYSKEKFQIFTGYDEVDPFIFDEVTEDVKASIAKNYGQTFEQFMVTHKDRVIEVPTSLRKFYQTDIYYALRALSGRTVRGGSMLLKNPQLLDKSYVDDLQNPLLAEIPTLSLFSDDTVEDYIDVERLKANYEDGCKVYIHLDLSQNGDRTGFGAVYKSQISGRFRELLVMAIHKRQEADEIDWDKVLDTIFYLTEMGCEIGYISYDHFAGPYVGQTLMKRYGKERAGPLSLDKDDSHYLLLLFLLKKGMLENYRYDPLDVSLKNLHHDRASMKVDHDDAHEKDVADGYCGALSNCYRFEGVSREEIVAVQMSGAGDDPERYFDDLIAGAKDDDSGGWYADILANS